MRNAISLLVLTSTVGIARADLPRCSQAQADLAYTAQDLPDAQGDTGWFPSGSPAQLRLTGQLVGKTAVAMSVAPTACWGDAMTIGVTGVAQSGLLDSEYGAAFLVLGQIHTSVLGYSIDWEGQLPLPYWLPNNLLMAGTTAFDPLALPDSSQPVVAVTSNETSPVVLLSTDVLSSLIDITGISGGVRIEAQGVITTSYQTTAIAIGGATLASTGAQATIAEPAGGFAHALAEPISASGVVHYSPSIVLSANLYASIFHITIVNWTVASVTVPLPEIDRSVELTAKPLAFPLPRLDPIPTSLGFATGAVQSLALHNAGDMALAIELDSAPQGVTAAPISIPPGQDGMLQVTAADPSSLAGASLVLATNDPTNPTIAVALDGSGHGETTMPAAGDHAGCDASGGAGGAFVLIALAALLAMARENRSNIRVAGRGAADPAAGAFGRARRSLH